MAIVRRAGPLADLRSRARRAGVSALHSDDFTQEKAITGALWEALRAGALPRRMVLSSLATAWSPPGWRAEARQWRVAWSAATPAPDLVLHEAGQVRVVIEVKVEAKLNWPQIATAQSLPRLPDALSQGWSMSNAGLTSTGQPGIAQTDLYRCFDWSSRFKDVDGQALTLGPAPDVRWLLLDARGRDGRAGREHALDGTHSASHWQVQGFADLAQRLLSAYEARVIAAPTQVLRDPGMGAVRTLLTLLVSATKA